MISLLKNKFINGSLEETKGKKQIAMLCSIVGVVLNIFLFIMKYLIGFFSGSVSIMADAFNNITDAGTSVAMMLGVKIASYGKGKKHPMGHGRFEWIISSLMAFLVMIIGWNLLTDSFHNIGNAKPVEANLIMIVLMVLSVGIKFYMYLYNKKYGRIIDSETMKAVATDSISDAVATIAVIVSVLISLVFHVNVDGYCGILVSLFIIYNGFQSLCETAGRIMGEVADEEELKEIQSIVIENGFFQNIYELTIEDYGMGRQRAIIRTGYVAECTGSELQEQLQRVYNRIFQEKGLDTLIIADKLIEPEMTEHLREILTEIIKEVEPFSYIDSIRIIGGEREKSIYCDVAIPKSKEDSEPIIAEKIKQAVMREEKDFPVYPTFTIFHDVSEKSWMNEKNAKSYDEFMEKRMLPRYYDANLAKHHEILKELLSDVTNKKVLDVACGNCDAVCYLSNSNAYIGLDISKYFEESARQKLQQAGFKKAEFMVGNACAMKVDANSMDVVLCNLSMQIIYPCTSFIHEIKRVMKKGGLFIGSMPVNDYGKQHFNYNNEIGTSNRLKEFLEENGFQVVISEARNGAICYFTAHYQ